MALIDDERRWRTPLMLKRIASGLAVTPRAFHDKTPPGCGHPPDYAAWLESLGLVRMNGLAIEVTLKGHALMRHAHRQVGTWTFRRRPAYIPTPEDEAIGRAEGWFVVTRDQRGQHWITVRKTVNDILRG